MRATWFGWRRAGIAAGLAGLALGPAACGSSSSTPAGTAPCPRIAILADGADLTRFRPGAARDLTAQVLDARVAGFDARCDYASRDGRTLDIRITPRFEAERGPTAEGRTADLPWFVAMTDAADTRVLVHLSDTVRVGFPANVGRATANGRPAQITLPLEEGKRATDYTIRISFQLTPEELALNRSRRAR